MKLRPTVVGLGVSLAVLVLHFDTWYLLVTGVNVAVIVAIALMSRPTKSVVGA